MILVLLRVFVSSQDFLDLSDNSTATWNITFHFVIDQRRKGLLLPAVQLGLRRLGLPRRAAPPPAFLKTLRSCLLIGPLNRKLVNFLKTLRSRWSSSFSFFDCNLKHYISFRNWSKKERSPLACCSAWTPPSWTSSSLLPDLDFLESPSRRGLPRVSFPTWTSSSLLPDVDFLDSSCWLSSGHLNCRPEISKLIKEIIGWPDFFFNLQLRFWEDFHVEYLILKRNSRCFEAVLVILEVV